jgi:hypothetical protein
MALENFVVYFRQQVDGYLVLAQTFAEAEATALRFQPTKEIVRIEKEND